MLTLTQPLEDSLLIYFEHDTFDFCILWTIKRRTDAHPPSTRPFEQFSNGRCSPCGSVRV